MDSKPTSKLRRDGFSLGKEVPEFTEPDQLRTQLKGSPEEKTMLEYSKSYKRYLNKQEACVADDVAETLVISLRKLVAANVSEQLDKLKEGIVGGQIAAAVQNLKREGMGRVLSAGADEDYREDNQRGETDETSLEVIAPVHLLTILESIPSDGEFNDAEFFALEGTREHYSKYLDAENPDEDFIDYSGKDVPWEDNAKHAKPADIASARHSKSADVESQLSHEGLFQFGNIVNPQQEATLRTLLRRFEKVFQHTLNREPAKLPPLELNVNDSKWKVPPNRRAARFQSTLKNQEIQLQVEKMLDMHLIRPSQNAEKSQVVLAKKPDGSWRFCIDYRTLNEATESMGWPIPNIPQMLQRIGAKRPKYFCVMDLTMGFFQAPLAENSRGYTTFTTWFGNYEWLRVPMGIKGAPSWFQQQIGDTVLGGLIHQICELYIDDVIIYGETYEEYLENIERVLTRFAEYNITVSPKKCKFLMDSIEYLGHKIDKEGISFSDKQKESVLNFQLPETVGKLKQFMGVCEYFHSHVRNFSIMSRPLNLKLHGYSKKAKGKRVYWQDDDKEAFYALQSAIDNCPVLYYPDPEGEIFLETDASDYGMGAYLYQKAEGGERPIAFVSKTLQGAQTRWSTPEKEAYAIFYALQKLEHLLRDVHFILRTDHKNLTYINYGKSQKIMRWKMMIQEYDFDIEHVAGEENVIADAFSRLVQAEGLDTAAVSMLIRARVGGQSIKARGFRLTDENYKIIKQFHNDIVGHHGVDETARIMLQQGHSPSTFPNLRTNVMAFIHKCACCQKMDQRKPQNKSHPFVLGSYVPMQKVSVDTIGPLEKDHLGNQYIVAMTDCFSRFTVLFPTRDATAKSAARAILHWVGLFGKPDYLLSDMGTQYINKHIDALLLACKTHKLDILAGVHQKNGIQERRNKEVNRHLRAIMFHRDMKSSWSDAVPLVQRIINAQYVESLGTTPASIIFGDMVKLDNGLTLQIDEKTASSHENKVLRLSEWTENMLIKQRDIIRLAQLTQTNVHDQYFETFEEESITKFPITSYVLVNHGDTRPYRLTTEWKGPYRVIAQDKEDPDRYTVQNLITMKEEDFPASRMKLFIPNEFEDPADAAYADTHDLIVEKILSHSGDHTDVVNLRFTAQLKGNTQDTFIYRDLKNNEALHAYLTELGGEWLALIPIQYTNTGEHYMEMYTKRKRGRPKSRIQSSEDETPKGSGSSKTEKPKSGSSKTEKPKPGSSKTEKPEPGSSKTEKPEITSDVTPKSKRLHREETDNENRRRSKRLKN